MTTKINTSAVQVIKASKGYGNGAPVINNLTMTVQSGTIYGLLGASGCGKTTMLSCIVGIRKLNSGEITVFGVHPGTPNSGIPGRTVGYMPQDIALYNAFTIKESLQYYGRIYGMTSSEIIARTEFLVNFLDLPKANRKIGSLSGGQQRRVSLAVAMVHQPELLILDEPTVGVDPLIRESIWEYLTEMVNKRGTTVIITTHYIEEARQSNMIGLMRNGRLLTEKPPQTLLEEHKTNLLEDIVLKLCRKDTFGTGETDLSDDISKTIAETSFYGLKLKTTLDDPVIEPDVGVVGLKFKIRSPDDSTLFWPRKKSFIDRRANSAAGNFTDDVWNGMEKILAIAVRNLILIWRNPMLMYSLILLPTLQLVLFYLIVGKSPQNLGIAVVNREFESLDFLDSCRTREIGCFKDELSCSYMKILSDNNFNIIPVASDEEALTTVQNGRAWGYLSIPSNYTSHMKDRSVWRNFVTNDTMDGSTLTARIDNTLVLISGHIISTMFSGYLNFIKGTVSECGEDPRIVDIPLKFNAIYGTTSGENGYRQYMGPAQIFLIMFLLPMASAITIIQDKIGGTLERSMVAGVKNYQILIGFIISEVLFMILELSLCLTAATVVFQFQFEGSIAQIFILCILTGICGLSFGFLIGVTSETQVEAVISVAGLYIPVFLSSGATWPLEGNSPWTKVFCNILPGYLPVESFRSMANRGWGATHPYVWPGFAVLITWSALFCIVSAIFLKLKS